MQMQQSRPYEERGITAVVSQSQNLISRKGMKRNRGYDSGAMLGPKNEGYLGKGGAAGKLRTDDGVTAVRGLKHGV